MKPEITLQNLYDRIVNYHLWTPLQSAIIRSFFNAVAMKEKVEQLPEPVPVWFAAGMTQLQAIMPLERDVDLFFEALNGIVWPKEQNPYLENFGRKVLMLYYPPEHLDMMTFGRMSKWRRP